MSLYNMLFGVNPATFYILPLLGAKHPDDYPRFRDCFVAGENNDEIHVYTRVGGDNRGQGYGEEELYKHPNYLRTFDDDFDNTYATYVFSVPEEWKEDFDLITSRKGAEVSQAYKERFIATYPKLEGKFQAMFSSREEVKDDN